MSITDNQIRFALRLWESLTIDGQWIAPNIGKYVRTGDKTLTLVELFTSRVADDDFNLFDRHDWIVELGNSVGWVITENIQIAYDLEKKPRNIPENMIGKVAACSNGCGVVIRVEPPTPWIAFQVIKERVCPHCKEVAFDSEWNDVHVVVDDKSVRTLASKGQGYRGEEE